MRNVPTIDYANCLAKEAVDILFSESDPFNGKVDKTLLESAIAGYLLINLVLNNSDELTEIQFMDCIARATIPEKLN